MIYPAAQPHDLPKQITEDLFVVYGSIKLNPLMRITRNMVVVRDAGELTLINPVRMNEPGLAALEKLGEVKHVLRLGPMHGIDDPFYVDQYKTTFWAFEGGEIYTAPAITHALEDLGELPFGRAQLYAFSELKETEGYLVFERDPGVLVTTDGVQSYSTPPHMPHTPWWVRKLMPFAGFPNKTIIGPVWVKLLEAHPEVLQKDFERMLQLDFDQMIAAHGMFLKQGAREEIAAAVKKMFG